MLEILTVIGDGMKKTILVSLYASMLAIANVAAVKIVSIGDISFTAGIFPIAIAFLVSDVIVENYGEKEGNKAVWGGTAALGSTVVLTQFIATVPGKSIVNEVFASSLPILIASLITIIISQRTDVWLFSRIKERLPYKITRNVGSTTITQLVDTALFTLLAFKILPQLVGGQILSIAVIVSIIATEWVVKTILSIIDTPLFYALTRND